MTITTAPRAAIPFVAFAGALRVLERNLMVYRRSWIIILSGFFEPVFYLFSIGIGVGQLVGDVQLTSGRAVSYAAFVGPALLASSAMNGAVYESTMNIFFKLKYDKVYDGMLATPLEPNDVAIGEISWSLLRGLLYAIGFTIVMSLFGLATSWWAVMAIPAALLIGFAFAAVGMAATTYMRSWQDFDLVTLVTLPMFLFSATFYPLDVYPASIRPFVRLSPLYHGVELMRGFTLGQLDASMLGHTLFLVVMGGLGTLVASRRVKGLLHA
jgi:lipooligosaccharide transport system permease protein